MDSNIIIMPKTNCRMLTGAEGQEVMTSVLGHVLCECGFALNPQIFFCGLLDHANQWKFSPTENVPL